MNAKASIGTRYTTQHVERRDTLSGAYEELNPPVAGTSMTRLQIALLDARPIDIERRMGRLRVVRYLIVLMFIIALIGWAWV